MARRILETHLEPYRQQHFFARFFANLFDASYFHSITMTILPGKRMTVTAIAPELLVSQKKFESILGPFWIYLLAILFHMTAAGMMCIIGVNKRFALNFTFLLSLTKKKFQKQVTFKVQILVPEYAVQTIRHPRYLQQSVNYEVGKPPFKR